jgi:hypothetical protein
MNSSMPGPRHMDARRKNIRVQEWHMIFFVSIIIYFVPSIRF